MAYSEKGIIRCIAACGPRTWFIRSILAVTVVVIYTVERNGTRPIQTSEWLVLLIELSLYYR